MEGLKKLAKFDTLVQITTDESGHHVVAGCGELHVEICIKQLETEYANCPIIKTEPVVQFKETVTELSSQVCMTKSPNNHNRLYGKAEPLHADLPDAIEKGTVSAKDDVKARAKLLSDEYNWDREEALKIWAFGPDNAGPNILTEKTSAA